MRTFLKHFKQRLLRKHPHAGPHAEADASLPEAPPHLHRPQEEPHLDAELADLDAVRGAGERLYAAEPDAAPAAGGDARAAHEQGSPDVEHRESVPESLEDRPAQASSGLDAGSQPALEGPVAGEGDGTPEPERASALARARQAVATRVSAAREKLSHGRFASRQN